MVPRTFAIVGMAVGALGTAMVVATVSTGSLLGPIHSNSRSGSSTDVSAHHTAGGGIDEGIPAWFTVTMAVLLVGYLLGLAVLLWRRHLEATEDEHSDEARVRDPAAGGAWTAIVEAELDLAAHEALDRLAEGTPRNAIVRCWMALQRATAGAGLAEQVAETPVEYTERAMRDLGLPRRAIGDLVGLYREARFSEHAMSEAHRAGAGHALQTLADALVARRARPGPEQRREAAPTDPARPVHRAHA